MSKHDPSTETRGSVRRALPAMVFLAFLPLGGCVTSLPPTSTPPPVEPPAVSAIPPPSSTVYIYPSKGQTDVQLDRDRYECHVWAVKQTGYDPSQPRLAPHQRVAVVAMPPPGASTVAGAAGGAIIGAAVARPHDAAGGAIIGAVAGAVLGASSEAAQRQQVDRIQQRYDQRDAQLQAQLEQQTSDYRRAIGACLEGRGYTVK